MTETDQASPSVEKHASQARKATGWLLLPFGVGALGVWFAFPPQWNAVGVKFILILLPIALAIKDVPFGAHPSEDKWGWYHFAATVAYLILVSWFALSHPVLVGCYWGVCF
jgi:hypothetical protein